MLLCLPVKVCKDYLALKHQGPHLHAEPIAIRALLNARSPVRLLLLLAMKASEMHVLLPAVTHPIALCI